MFHQKFLNKKKIMFCFQCDVLPSTFSKLYLAAIKECINFHRFISINVQNVIILNKKSSVSLFRLLMGQKLFEIYNFSVRCFRLNFTFFGELGFKVIEFTNRSENLIQTYSFGISAICHISSFQFVAFVKFHPSSFLKMQHTQTHTNRLLDVRFASTFDTDLRFRMFWSVQILPLG